MINILKNKINKISVRLDALSNLSDFKLEFNDGHHIIKKICNNISTNDNYLQFSFNEPNEGIIYNDGLLNIYENDNLLKTIDYKIYRIEEINNIFENN